MIKKVIRTLAFIIIVVLLMGGFLMTINPIRRSTGSIRRSLLREMPIGTSMEDVIQIIESNRAWTLKVVQMEFGLVLSPVGNNMIPIRDVNPSGFPNSPVVGEKSIRIHMGRYITFTWVDVEAYFAFDGEGYLLDIFIRKELDVI